MTLNRNLPVQTRDGRKVTIYTWDAPEERSVYGRVEGVDCTYTWLPTGNYLRGGQTSKDLINAPGPKCKVKGWMNVYRDANGITGIFCESFATAVIYEGTPNIIARKRIEFEIEEGTMEGEAE